jgi:hypothetical protein
MNLAFPKPKKRKKKKRPGMDPKHLENIRKLPCCVPGCPSIGKSDAHHLKQGLPDSERGMGRRASDQYTVPLCAHHHINGVERFASKEERTWFATHNVRDPLELAKALWKAKDIEEMRKL